MSDPWLAGPVVTAVYGWKLERRDGVTLGFTSHDRDIYFEGLLLKASPGLRPASITQSVGLSAGGLDISGVLSSSAIREDDLEMGRWNGASLSIFLFDWTNPAAGKRLLASGELGAIRQKGIEFETELRGPAALLDRSIVPVSSPTCRAEFCGAQCKLNSLRFEHRVSVNGVVADTLYFSAPLPAPFNGFARGTARQLSGTGCGLKHDIVASGADCVRLALPVAQPLVAGDRVLLLEGCDRRLATCSTRFANTVNFRGEPHLPGNDLLTRYPGSA